MPRTPSTMVDLLTTAPEFNLPDPDGRMHGLEDAAAAPAVLVAFICNHCPFVTHIADQLSELAREWKRDGLAIYAIMSNDVETHPADHPSEMAKEMEARSYTFPYLYDEDQSVAKAFGAACTPDFFLFDADRRLVYRGQFCDSRPGGEEPVTGADLDTAVEAVLEGRPVPDDQRPSLGCNIKWKPENEPSA
ncbi:MAG: thioredoxin family protein [Phycisphaerales bacterium]|jgi:peroxiredoxin|nr:thioredoxin family protein [Phycisphaerales bacterium]